MLTLAQEQTVRHESTCRGCGGAKDVGCLLCWHCFKYRPDCFKYRRDCDFNAWLVAIGRAEFVVDGSNGEDPSRAGRAGGCNVTCLFEKYRPRAWQDVVGQDKALETVALLRQRSGLGGHAFWISGQSGQGKSTLAYLIAHDTADEFNVMRYNATEFGLAEARQAVRSCRTLGLGSKTGRALIVNEAHALRKDVLIYLDDAIEPVPDHVVWVFTTTREGQKELFDDHFDAGPVLSRCITLALTKEGHGRWTHSTVKGILSRAT